jgi:GNAT superfamily N-acetyltransferase
LAPPPADAVAVESWFASGVSVVAAWRDEEGRAILSATNHPTMDAAASHVAALGARRPYAGSSLIDHPAFRGQGLRPRPRTGRAAEAVTQLADLLREDGLRHDAGAHLTAQVLDVRTPAAADGPRVVSGVRTDAIKAAVWAATAARKATARTTKILLPTR